MKKRSSAYRPLGVSLRSFAQRRIRSYVPGGDLVTRSPALPPSWAADAQAPLQWGAAVSTPAAPASTPAYEPPVQAAPAGIARAIEAAEAPAAEVVETETERAEWSSLSRILAAHQQRDATERARLAAETAAVAAAREVSGDSATTGSVQRMPDQDREILANPGSRRRPAAVMEVTPPKPTGIFDERLWDEVSAPPKAEETDSSEPEMTSSPGQPALAPNTADLLAHAGQPAPSQPTSAQPVQRSTAPEPAPTPATQASAQTQPVEAAAPVQALQSPAAPNSDAASVPALVSAPVDHVPAPTTAAPTPPNVQRVTQEAAATAQPPAAQRSPGSEAMLAAAEASGGSNAPALAPPAATPPAPPSVQRAPAASPASAPPPPAGQASAPALPPPQPEAPTLLQPVAAPLTPPAAAEPPINAGDTVPSAAHPVNAPALRSAQAEAAIQRAEAPVSDQSGPALAAPAQMSRPAETTAQAETPVPADQKRSVQPSPEVGPSPFRPVEPSAGPGPLTPKVAVATPAPADAPGSAEAVAPAPPGVQPASAPTSEPSVAPADQPVAELLRKAEAPVPPSIAVFPGTPPSSPARPTVQGASAPNVEARVHEAPATPDAPAAPVPPPTPAVQPGTSTPSAQRSAAPANKGVVPPPAADQPVTGMLHNAEAPVVSTPVADTRPIIRREMASPDQPPASVFSEPPAESAHAAETPVASPASGAPGVQRAAIPSNEAATPVTNPPVADLLRRAEAPVPPSAPASAAPAALEPSGTTNAAFLASPPSAQRAAAIASETATPAPAADQPVSDTIEWADAPASASSATTAAAAQRETAAPAVQGETASPAGQPVAELLRKAEAPVPPSTATFPGVQPAGALATGSPSAEQQMADALPTAEAPAASSAPAKPAIQRTSAPAGGTPAPASPAVQQSTATPATPAATATPSALPDAPTVLEPAATPSLTATLQRAVAAAEAPPATGDALVPPARPAPVVLDGRLEPSPWSSFMQAPEPAPPVRPTPAAPPTVQRAAAPKPPPRPETPPLADSSVQRALTAAEAPASSDGDETDIYAALVAEGMVQPPPALPTPTSSPSPAPATAPAVQRKPASPPSNSSVPKPGTVEAAMLDLLKLPPDTPVYGLKQPPAETANAGTANSGPAIQRKPLDEALAEADSPSSSNGDTVQPVIEVDELTVTPDGGQGEGGAAKEPNIDELARKVYRILKDRLRVERERSAR